MNGVSNEGVMMVCRGAARLKYLDASSNYIGNEGIAAITRNYSNLKGVWLRNKELMKRKIV